jgi:RNA polymerase sigma factor (sigma-70 family)
VYLRAFETTFPPVWLQLRYFFSMVRVPPVWSSTAPTLQLCPQTAWTWQLVPKIVAKIGEKLRIHEKCAAGRGLSGGNYKYSNTNRYMPLDAEELGTLIANQAASLRLWIRSRCVASDDIVQEAFCRLATQDPRPDNPVEWLYRVCRNLAEKQRLADRRRTQREQDCAQSIRTASNPIDGLELQETLSAVEQLSDELREVLVARVWGQLSLEEVGQLCGISTATAFRRYETALKELRIKLELKCEHR